MIGNQIVNSLKKTELVQSDCRMYIIYLMKEMQLVRQCGCTNSKEGEKDMDHIRQYLGTISVPNNWLVFNYLLESGAVTSLIIRRRLGIPRRSAFHSLESLRNVGLIELATRAKVPMIVGKPANVYMLPTANVDDVRKAVKIHNLLFGSKKYRIADDLAQTILEEYNEKNIKEIYYRDIFQKVKKLKIPFNTNDISQMVHTILIENDLKVWK